MTDDPDREARLKDRLATLAETGGPRRKGPNVWAVAGVALCSGAAIGAWLVTAEPAADRPAPIPTSTVEDFQDAGGLEGWRIASSDAPQVTPKPSEDAEALRVQLAELQAQIKTLKANPKTVTVEDEAAVKALEARIAEMEKSARERENAMARLERDKARLQAQVETAALLGQTTDREAEREARLAAARAEHERVLQAQIQSDMVALRVGGGGAEDSAAAAADRYTGDESFVRAGAEAVEMRQAQRIANPGHTLMQGTLIEAALETAIETALEGNVVAIVSHDVWSFDMTRVLIPRGSKLFGRYSSDIEIGQARILVAWDRIVTTDGQSVRLAAYGTDRVGRSGLPGRVRTKFLQRFGSAALISVIGAIPALLADDINDETAADTAENVGNDFGDAVGQVMAGYLSMPPTISVDQGAVVMIRVDTDLEIY